MTRVMSQEIRDKRLLCRFATVLYWIPNQVGDDDMLRNSRHSREGGNDVDYCRYRRHISILSSYLLTLNSTACEASHA